MTVYPEKSTTIDPIGVNELNVEARIRCAAFFRLAEGYFHKLRNDLAKIVAEHELHLSQVDAVTQSKFSPADCSKEVIRLANQLSMNIDRLGQLHQLFAVGTSPSTAQEFCDGAGTLLHGALSWTRDSRSSDVTITSGPHIGGDFPIDNDLITSLLFPVIIKILDEVVASGEIIVRSVQSSGTGVIRLQVEKSIIGHVDLETILSSFDGKLYLIDGNSLRSLCDESICLGKFGSADGPAYYMDFHTNVWAKENRFETR